MLELRRWEGTWSPDDPDANLKHDVVLYGHVDPLGTLSGLSGRVGIPVGALARYVLSRRASAGSETLLSVGPSIVERLLAICERAEEMGTPEARLDAYESMRQIVTWLHIPLSPDDT